MLSITTIDNEIINVEDWKSIKKPILRMSFQINEKQAVVLEGFESYLRVKEMYQAVNCDMKGMSKIILLGQSMGQVAVVEIDCRTGKVSQTIKKRGHEYNNRPLSKSAWVSGVPSKPRIYLQD